MALKFTKKTDLSIKNLRENLIYINKVLKSYKPSSIDVICAWGSNKKVNIKHYNRQVIATMNLINSNNHSFHQVSDTQNNCSTFNMGMPCNPKHGYNWKMADNIY